jgi:predicted nucleotidyltransferase component of viral defense system
MIKEISFTEEWLESFKKQAEHKKIDKIILEKMIYAIHLLEHIQINGLDFVFKGGTSLVLLLNKVNRFSIDIDIICETERKNLEAILDKVIESSRFNSYSLDEHRSYKEGVPKAHYGFEFDSVTNAKYSGKILLDVLIEDSIYPELTEKPIQCKWIKTEEEVLVTVPTIDSITGDKLTAFAPNTIGIPYYKGEISFSMEICKQLFDLSKLFEQIEKIDVVAECFQVFAEQEIIYRNSQELMPKSVLQDTIDTCIILAKKGKGDQQEKTHFIELQKGIKAFGFGFLMSGNFRIDDAVAASARVAYLAAKLLKKDLSPIQYYNKQDIKDWNIENQDWIFLNPLKRQPDKSSFYYWFKAVELLTKEREEIVLAGEDHPYKFYQNSSESKLKTWRIDLGEEYSKLHLFNISLDPITIKNSLNLSAKIETQETEEIFSFSLGELYNNPVLNDTLFFDEKDQYIEINLPKERAWVTFEVEMNSEVGNFEMKLVCEYK